MITNTTSKYAKKLFRSSNPSIISRNRRGWQTSSLRPPSWSSTFARSVWTLLPSTRTPLLHHSPTPTQPLSIPSPLHFSLSSPMIDALDRMKSLTEYQECANAVEHGRWSMAISAALRITSMAPYIHPLAICVCHQIVARCAHLSGDYRVEAERRSMAIQSSTPNPDPIFSLQQQSALSVLRIYTQPYQPLPSNQFRDLSLPYIDALRSVHESIDAKLSSEHSKRSADEVAAEAIKQIKKSLDNSNDNNDAITHLLLGDLFTIRATFSDERSFANHALHHYAASHQKSFDPSKTLSDNDLSALKVIIQSPNGEWHVPAISALLSISDPSYRSTALSLIESSDLPFDDSLRSVSLSEILLSIAKCSADSIVKEGLFRSAINHLENVSNKFPHHRISQLLLSDAYRDYGALLRSMEWNGRSRSAEADLIDQRRKKNIRIENPSTFLLWYQQRYTA